MKHCPVSSTSYDLCTCKVWSCYVQRFMGKCIYKKYQGHLKHCPLHRFMWPMYLQSLQLLWPMVKEMHYQENTLFDLGPKVKGVKVTQNLPSTINLMWPTHQQNLMLLHPMVKEKMHLQENTIFDLGSLEVATSKGLWGDAYTRKFNFWPLILTLGSRSHEMLPSTYTSCDLFSYKVWSCYA